MLLVDWCVYRRPIDFTCRSDHDPKSLGLSASLQHVEGAAGIRRKIRCCSYVGIGNTDQRGEVQHDIATRNKIRYEKRVSNIAEPHLQPDAQVLWYMPQV